MSAAELIYVDQYCGGGGATEGLEQAAAERGIPLRGVAINHSPVAIVTHSRNHPRVRHHCEDLALVAPRTAVPGGRADILLSGPSCTHFASARGGKPVNDQERMHAWQVTDWCAELDVTCVVVENVPEFRSWGPLCTLLPGHDGPHRHEDGRDLDPDVKPCDKPVPERKAEYFEAWLREFVNLGYRYEHRILNAADFGGATSRRRFFLQARKDGLPISWPAPTHGPAGEVGRDLFDHRKPWRAAREVLDLGDLGTSMLDRRDPLSPNTRLRAARGFLRFCGALGPFYVRLLDLPEELLAKLPRAEVGSWSPFLLGQQSGSVARAVGEPVPTIAAGGAIALVQPFLINQRDSWDGHRSVPGLPRGMGDPVQTVTTESAIGLVQPHLSLYYGNSQADSVDEPLSTLTTKPRHALVSGVVVPYGPRAAGRTIADPMLTILTKDRLGLASATIEPFIVPNFGEDNRGKGQAPRVHRVGDPMPTVTGRGAGNLITPTIDPVDDLDGVDPRRLVWIDRELYLLDIFYRMLRPAELAAAMGFGPTYYFAGSSRDVVRQIGNAWEVNLARALTGTVLDSLRGRPLEAAA